MKRLSELLTAVETESVLMHDTEITRIVCDSRQVEPGALFVARKSAGSDGHDFIPDALSRGASAVVCEQPAQYLSSVHVPILRVSDSQVAAAQLSHFFYDNPFNSLRVIGITGTNGKTTCTYLIRSMLEQFDEHIGLIGTTGNFIGREKFNSNFTTPEAPELCMLARRMVDSGCRYCVMEVSSHALSLHRTHGIHFSAALFTNLSQDHLDFHRTMQDYAASKKLLFDSLSPSAFAVVNADDPHAEFMVSDTSAQVIYVGRGVHCNVRISDEHYTRVGSTFYLNQMECSTGLVGTFNIDNAALAFAALCGLGYDSNDVRQSLRNAKGAPGRMTAVELENGATAVVDYAHTPDALEKALVACRSLTTENSRLICLFGCGGERDSLKRPLMGSAAARLADVVVVTSDNPRTEDPQQIIDNIMEGVPAGTIAFTITDRREAIRFAKQLSKSEDIVLVAGKGHEEYQLIGRERLNFNDIDELMR
jgi:UDP-N-acetylmuramyl-tripeptide synthetase